MRKIDVDRVGVVALDIYDDRGSYPASSTVNVSLPATSQDPDFATLRVLVEIQRRFGGISPRAMIGGQLTVSPGTDIDIEVRVGISEGEVCSSRLWKRPFLAGLPNEYARAASDAIAADGARYLRLPSGVLVVDRAGFDEINSSSVIFSEAARVLLCVLLAELEDLDVETRVRELLHSW